MLNKEVPGQWLRRIATLGALGLFSAGAACSSFPAESGWIGEFPEAIEADPNSGLAFSLIRTAQAEAPEAFLYAGGSYLRRRPLAHIAVLVRHRTETFLFDTGLGRNINQQFEAMPFWVGPFFAYETTTAAADVIAEGREPLDRIFVSHLHWDHASGLPDFPNTPVWLRQEEYENAIDPASGPPAFVREQYEAIPNEWNFVQFDDGPYELFDQSSDLFGDGSVVFVPLNGHTPGSMGMFLNLPSGRRFFFTGDLSWALEGLVLPAQKYFVSRSIVDGDAEETRATLARVHRLLQERPGLNAVPAHDALAQAYLARYPAFEH